MSAKTNALVVPPETVAGQMDWIGYQLKYWESKRRALFHRIAKKGRFPLRPVVIAVEVKENPDMDPAVLFMRRIGSWEGEAFFYDADQGAFYSADNSAKWKVKGFNRYCNHVTFLWDANTSWHRLSKLMFSKNVRKVIEAIDE